MGALNAAAAASEMRPTTGAGGAMRHRRAAGAHIHVPTTSSRASADARAPSTLRRELVFVVRHATHHFFVAALVAKGHLGVALPDDVGRAPATLRNDSQRGAYIDIGG